MEGVKADRLSWAAFSAMVAGIGANAVAIKFTLREPGIDPAWSGASRFLIAAIVFATIALVVRAPVPKGRELAGAVLYGMLSFGGFFGLVYWGLQHVPASLAGVFFATVPFLTFLFSLAHNLERFQKRALAGALLVVVGTAVITRESLDEGAPLLPVLAIVAAAACAAEGSIVVKLSKPRNPVVWNAIGTLTGSVMLLILMPLMSQSAKIPERATTWVAQGYLVTFGSIGVFGLYLFLLKRWTASAVSYEFVLAPIVGIGLSAWLLNEHITGSFLAGAILILAGVYFGVLRRAQEQTEEAPKAERAAP
jgi:drug/metabolite transporter (DMT)-like permease